MPAKSRLPASIPGKTSFARSLFYSWRFRNRLDVESNVASFAINCKCAGMLACLGVNLKCQHFALHARPAFDCRKAGFGLRDSRFALRACPGRTGSGRPGRQRSRSKNSVTQLVQPSAFTEQMKPRRICALFYPCNPYGALETLRFHHKRASSASK